MSGRDRGTSGVALLLGALSSLFAAEPARAQETADGFALDRFDPAQRGSHWFAADSLDLRGDARWAAGAVVDWAHRPLVAYDENDDANTLVVENQAYLHLGAAFVWIERVRFALGAPVLFYQSGDEVKIDGQRYAADGSAAFGDIRLAGDARLFGEHGDPVTLAAGVAVHVPSGDRDAYAGDGKARFVPRVQVAGQSSEFVYAARLGTNVRLQNEEFAGEPFGTELVFTAAAGASLLEDQLVVGPELFLYTVLAKGGAFERLTTPAEILFGAHYDVVKDWRVGLGVGPGLSRGFGAPAVRGLLSIEWVQGVEQPPPEPVPDRDSDLDTILDSDDACPYVAGVGSADPAKNGCPPPPDSDHDGIPNEFDMCQNVPGVANEDDPAQNGCPIDDLDEDGILNLLDACPNEAGIANESDPGKHGCPVRDADGDGILDEADGCPKDPGEPNPSVPEKHGCPKAVLEKGEIRILERIEFETGLATLRPESEPVLQAVLNVLKKHDDITKIEVQGHTDNVGVPFFDKDLSQKRAASVVAWLISNGIAADRLVPVGYGQEKPIDNNDTELGRQNNRRVQFVILERASQSDETEER